MRELTDEELALAPEWATHYHISKIGNQAWFVDLKNNKAVTLHMIKSGEHATSFGGWFNGVDLPPIPRKPFDISEHEWSDNLVSLSCISRSGESVLIEVNLIRLRLSDGYAIGINKADAIAIAKALGVTGEDLG